MRTCTLLLSVVAALAVLSACTPKDKEVINRKGSTLDTFVFTPKSAAEMAASAPRADAATPKTTLDTFVFKPKSAAEMSAPRPAPSRPPSTLDTFVFRPKTAAEMAASPVRK